MDYEDMLPKGVLEGSDWTCTRCSARFSRDYEPDRCLCGGQLMRVFIQFTLPEANWM